MIRKLSANCILRGGDGLSCQDCILFNDDIFCLGKCLGNCDTCEIKFICITSDNSETLNVPQEIYRKWWFDTREST